MWVLRLDFRVHALTIVAISTATQQTLDRDRMWQPEAMKYGPRHQGIDRNQHHSAESRGRRYIITSEHL
jgi:hypothetical protein